MIYKELNSENCKTLLLEVPVDDKKLYKNNKLSYLLIFVFIISAISINYYLFLLQVVLSMLTEDLLWVHMINIIIMHFIFMLPVLPQKELKRKVFYVETAIVIISFIICTASYIDVYF